jgi:hypothetical protein
MKYLSTILAFSLFIVASANAISITNSTLAEVKQTAITNLNQVVIEVLQSGRAAGSEIYAASKEAIIQSVDFVKSQAPEVFREFILWHLGTAILWFLIVGCSSIFLLFASHVANRRSKDPSLPDQHDTFVCKNDFTLIKWVLRTVAFVVLMANLGINGTQIVKISVAPRIYLIEYVVNTIQSSSNQR